MDKPLHELIADTTVIDSQHTQDLVTLARLISEKGDLFAGRLRLYFENIMAQAYMQWLEAFPPCDDAFGNWGGPGKANEQVAGHQRLAWAMFQSAVGLSNRIIGTAKLESVAEVLAFTQAFVAEYEAAATMATGEADAEIRKTVEALSAEFPQLGLSYGYVGNLSPQYDDRSFKVFTVLRDRGMSVSFGGYPASRLGHLCRDVRKGLRAWCEEQAKQLADGKILKVA